MKILLEITSSKNNDIEIRTFYCHFFAIFVSMKLPTFDEPILAQDIFFIFYFFKSHFMIDFLRQPDHSEWISGASTFAHDSLDSCHSSYCTHRGEVVNDSPSLQFTPVTLLFIVFLKSFILKIYFEN